MPAFPETGHTTLSAGDWVWKSRPQDSGPEGMFDAVSAVIAINLPYGTTPPALFAKGRKLVQTDFPGTRLPAGDFYCAGLTVRDEKFNHATYDVKWLGAKDGEGITPSTVHLLVEGLGAGAVFSLREFSEERSEVPVEFPQNGTAPGDPGVIYATSAFLPPGIPEINPETGEYQRVRLYIETVTRIYSGILVGAGSYYPTRFRCVAPSIDTDSPLIDLSGTASGAVRIRVATWWPTVATDTTEWKLESVPIRVFRQLGGKLLSTFEARFRYQPRLDF